MTTTQLFSGMDTDAKPSSKVMAPPGGKTSISLFGDPEPAPKTNKPRLHKGEDDSIITPKIGAAAGHNANANNNTKTEAKSDKEEVKKAAENDNVRNKGDGVHISSAPILTTKDRVFGEYDPTVYHKTTNEIRLRDTKNRLFGTNVESDSVLMEQVYEFEQIASESRSQRSINQEVARGTYNPITGEEIIVQGSAHHTSTRVRQPPGGASSGSLW